MCVCVHATVYMWLEDNLQESVLSYHVGPRNCGPLLTQKPEPPAEPGAGQQSTCSDDPGSISLAL